MVQKMELNHVHYSDNEVTLNKFYQGFGKLDKVAGAGLQALMPVKADTGKKPEEIDAQFSKHLS